MTEHLHIYKIRSPGHEAQQSYPSTFPGDSDGHEVSEPLLTDMAD